MHHLNSSSELEKDHWGQDLCNYSKSITFGLRTGPKNLLLGFAIGHLGMEVTSNGTLKLHRQPINVESKEVTATVSVPAVDAVRWPTDLLGVTIGGVNIGSKGQFLIACNVTSPSALQLTCAISPM